jgi:hypothetical protein
MEIFMFKDTPNVKLLDPEIGEGVYYCNITNGSCPFYIQTPKLNFEFKKNTLKVMFSNDTKNEKPDIADCVSKFYQTIQTIENQICLQLSESNWFSEKLDIETIKNELFQSSIKIPTDINNSLWMNVDLPIDNYTKNNDFEIYNKDKKLVSVNDLGETTECTFILYAKELHITPTNAKIKWELNQALAHRKSKKIKGFGIRDESSTIQKEKITIGFAKMPSKSNDIVECQQVKSSKIIPDDQSIIPDNRSIKSKKSIKSVIPDNQSVIPDNQSVIPDNQSVIPETQLVTNVQLVENTQDTQEIICNE